MISKTREMLDFARHQGYRPDEVIALIENLAS